MEQRCGQDGKRVMSGGGKLAMEVRVVSWAAMVMEEEKVEDEEEEAVPRVLNGRGETFKGCPNPWGWPVGIGLGLRDLLTLRSQVRNVSGTTNFCVGPVHTKLCSSFK